MFSLSILAFISGANGTTLSCDSCNIFQERQSSKDGSPCTFRLSSEGLPLLLPYITKQILYASAIDFQHLLQYRTIKFPDFVDAKFGEEASALLPGCCVVVLWEGNITSHL